MRVHLINPSDVSFGIAVIMPRWLYVLASATPRVYGDPLIVDETLEPTDPETIQPGDVVGIGIHTTNVLRGYELGRMARERGAYVVFGGIHPTLYPEEPREFGGAHAVVQGDGDAIWPQVLADYAAGRLRENYNGGRVEPGQFVPARWELMPRRSYMLGSVQTVRGCPKHCSFCSVWRTDGQRPRQRAVDGVVEEIVELRRLGFRFILLADDNFYPVTLEDLRLAERQNNTQRLAQLRAIREERFELMERLAELPEDMAFFTQITMEAAEDPQFLDAMKKARIKGALVGVESVTEEGLKAVYKNFNLSGDNLVKQLREFRKHGVHVLGSFIFGLPTDKPDTFDATAKLAQEADIALAQFITMMLHPGTVDFLRWEKEQEADPTRIAGFPLSRYWMIPRHLRPKLQMPHPEMSSEEVRARTLEVWDRFYSFRSVWKRSRGIAGSFRDRLMFVMISKLYRQMYGRTGLAADSARQKNATSWARWLAKPCQWLFRASPMPELKTPSRPAPETGGSLPSSAVAAAE